jgi:TonB family protein
MKKIIFSLFTCIILFGTNVFAQDPILQKLLDASGEEMYLTDFPFELNPGNEIRFSIVLSKNTNYVFYLYQEYEKQLIFKIDQKQDNSIEGGSIPVQPGVSQIAFSCPKSAVYHVKIKNISDKKLKSNCMLAFVNKIKSYDDEEIIPITAIADGNKKSKSENKEKNFFFIVDKMPKFNGKNSDEFKKYLNSKIEYPQEAIDERIQGRVFVQFMIDKSGYIKDAKVVRGVHPSIDQEALRIVYSSPKWKPGTQKGEPVDVVFTFPIIFKLK